MTQAAEKQQETIGQSIEVTTSQPPIVEFNYEQLKASLEQQLVDYDTVVTVDTLTQARRDATYLNQLAKIIDDKRKEVKAPLIEPINQFESMMKELVGLCQQARSKITEQIEKFNEESRRKVWALLDAERAQLWIDHEVEQRFRTAEFEDLVTQANLTSTGNLTAKALNKIKERVSADRSRQDRTRMRVLQLENQSHKAGLTVELTEDHVRHVIDTADDDAYQKEVDRIIDVELERENEAVRRRQQAEVRAAAARRQAQATNLPHETPPEPEAPPADVPPTEPVVSNNEPPSAPGKAGWVVIGEFHVETPDHVTPDKVEAELRRVLEGAGIKTLKSVKAHRKGVQ